MIANSAENQRKIKQGVEMLRLLGYILTLMARIRKVGVDFVRAYVVAAKDAGKIYGFIFKGPSGQYVVTLYIRPLDEK